MRWSRRWSELTGRERVAVVLGGAAQVGLQAAALLDLRRRPASEVTGSKRLWVGLSFVNFLGPLAYFLAGRRRRR
jgi:hypothetical protein